VAARALANCTAGTGCATKSEGTALLQQRTHVASKDEASEETSTDGAFFGRGDKGEGKGQMKGRGGKGKANDEGEGEGEGDAGGAGSDDKGKEAAGGNDDRMEKMWAMMKGKGKGKGEKGTEEDEGDGRHVDAACADVCPKGVCESEADAKKPECSACAECEAGQAGGEDEGEGDEGKEDAGERAAKTKIWRDALSTWRIR